MRTDVFALISPRERSSSLSRVVFSVLSSVEQVVAGATTEAARLDFLVPPKTGMERPMRERLGMEGEGWGMAEPWRARKGVVENSETVGWAFGGRLGLRTMGSGTVIETALAVGAGDGFMGDRSGRATSSSDAFLLSPACQLRYM